MRFVAYGDRKAVAAILRPIYTATCYPDEDAALTALTTFTDSAWGRKYPAAVATWENAWDRNTAVPGLRARPAQSHLHHEQHRYLEPPSGCR